MSSLSVNIQQRFTNLRKKLDQLGYMQPLSIDCLPLVENLFTDFVWTTDSFRKCKLELDKRMDIRENVEDFIEPYKKDNGRLLNENNRLQRKIMELKMEYEERLRDLHCQIRHLEEEKEDLKLFNIQCLDKLKKYEVESKQMVDKIMQLQEKNFQAVVHIPEGKRKQIPFRRQRMDVDFLIPRTESCYSENDDGNEYCCAESTDRDRNNTKQSDSYSSEKSDLLESVTNKCQQLSRQLRCATEELELNERKLENYSHQVCLYEEEIQRLTKELSGGRSIESLTLENQQRSRDRIYEQLTMQMDLLQQRNEELERELVRCNALNLEEGKTSGYRDMTNFIKDSDCVQSIQNRKLIDRIDELVNRESCLLKELHQANCRVKQKSTDCIPTIADNLEREIEALQNHIKSLEVDRNYWKKETENKLSERKESNRKSGSSNRESSRKCNQYTPNNEKENSRLSENPSNEVDDLIFDVNEIEELKQELKHCRHRLKDVTAENNELKQMMDRAEKSVSPPVKDKDHSRNVDAELKKTRIERDSLQELLNKFERQLHDIQGNIRVLTQERDMICERYEECQRELHGLRETIIQSENQRKDCTPGSHQQSLTAQSMLRRLEIERNESVNDLHKMTTERDSLRERLKTVSESALSEKARICQKLEDCENLNCQLLEDKEELIEKTTILRNKIGELEEHNHQLTKKNDSISNVLDKERGMMHTMKTDLQRFENEINKKDRVESQLSDELKNAENRLSTLQERLESQNLESEEYRNESIKLKEIITEIDREKDQMQSDVDEKIEQLKDLQTQLKVKEDALNEIRINMTSLEQQLRRINEINNHRDQELRALVVHNEQLENDMRHQVSKYDQIKAENTRLEEDLMGLTREHHKLDTELAEAQRYIMNVNYDREELKEKLIHLQKVGCEQKDQNSDLLDQYRNLSLDNDKLQLTVQKLEGDNEDLKAEIDAGANIVSHMREQLVLAEREINSNKSDIRHLENQILNLNQVMEGNEKITVNHSMEKHEILQELAAMRDLCARLENSKENVQRQLSSRLLEFEQIKAENNGLAKENENLREEIESLHDSIRNMETILSVGREKEFMNELEARQRITELESKNEQLAQLPSKIDQLQHDLRKSCRHLAELEAECEKLRRQLTSEKFKLELANQELRRRHKTSLVNINDPVSSVVESQMDQCLNYDKPADHEYYSTSSGVHTGRSFNTHTPTFLSSKSNANVSESDIRIATDRTEADNPANLEDNIES